jgi:hypothetical protein
MKKCALFAILCLLIASCTKKTDNYYANPTPSFAVSGLQDIRLEPNAITSASLNLTFQYFDSTQGVISLSLSGLPAGVNLDTNAILSGTPTFSTTLTFFDTSTSIQVAAGTYPITLTCYSSVVPEKIFTFNLIILPAQSLTASVIGKYGNSLNSCTGISYADSVYADASVVNKIYFRNFMNTGQTVYANVTTTSLTSQQYNIAIPQQTVNGYTFSNSTGSYYLSNAIYLNNIQYTLNGNTIVCGATMNR